MFDKFIANLHTKIKSDKWHIRLLAGIGFAIVAVLLFLKFKILQDNVEKGKVVKELDEDNKKDLQLDHTINNINRREGQIDQKIDQSNKALSEIVKDHNGDVKKHEASTKVIESINSWDDVDKIVRK